MEKNILHYEILEKLGAGGMGVVYKAHDTRLNRPVALKFLPEGILPGEENMKRFVREAQAASKLDHPNICAVHSIEETPDGRTFICMAWCDGETLAQTIAKRRLETAEALDIAGQVAAGLEEAHAAGIVHRDVKPSNVMVSSRNHVKILDFGLAKLADASRLSTSAATVGTVQYMSPEQAKGHELDPRSDIWSLGVVLYEMLTGSLPFGGDYQAAALYAIVHESCVPASRINPAVPPALDRIIARALKKEARDRYGSAREMREEMAALLETLRPAGDRGSPALPRRRSRRLTRRSVLAFCAAAAVVAAMILSYARFFGAAPEPVAIAVLAAGKAESDTSYASYIADLLSTDLGQNKYIKPVARDRVVELCRLLGIAAVNETTALLISRQARARILVVPRLARDGASVRLAARVFDVPARAMIFEESVPLKAGASVSFSAVDRLSDKLAKRLKLLPRWRPGAVQPRLAAAATTESESAYRSFQQGEELYRSNDPRGIPLIEEAVLLDSTFVRALLRLALWYDYSRDPKRAFACARKAKECARGDESDFMRAWIVELRLQGNYDKAVENMKSHLMRSPDDVRMQLDLGYVLYRFQKKFPEGVAQLRRVFEIDPQNLEGCWAKTYSCLGNAYLYWGRFDEAAGAFENYGQLNAGSPDVLHDIASVHFYRGEYEEAIERYRRIVELDPDYYWAYQDLGFTSLSLGKCGAAETWFDQYLDRTTATMKPQGYIFRGLAFLARGEEELAAKEAGRALALDSLSVPARWLLGRAAVARAGSAARAARELDAIERAMSRAGASRAAGYYYDLRAWVLLAEKRYDESLEKFRRAALTAEFLHEYLLFKRDYVRGALEAGRIDEAIDEGTALVSYNEHDGEALALLGRAYALRGSEEKAREYFRRAKAVWNGADPDFHPLAELASKL
jgi:tetratricopeptide (TPR) repeat protein